MSQLYETFDEENEEWIQPTPLKIKNEVDIIRYYNNIVTDLDLHLVYDTLEEFDIETKISTYRELIYKIYKDAFEEFLYNESPTHIFDTGLHNEQMIKFIDCIYYSSSKGKDLEFILNIYFEYLRYKNTIEHNVI